MYVCVLEGAGGSDQGCRIAALMVNFLISELPHRNCKKFPHNIIFTFVRFGVRMAVAIKDCCPPGSEDV